MRPEHEAGRRWEIVLGVRRLVFLNEVRRLESFVSDHTAQKRGRIGEELHKTEEAPGLAAIEADGRENGFKFRGVMSGRDGDGGQTKRFSGFERLLKEALQRQRRARIPMGEEVDALQLETEALAQSRAA